MAARLLSPSNKRPSAKQLEENLKEANTRLAAIDKEQQQRAAALEEAQQKLEEQTAALAAAQRELAAAREQALPASALSSTARTSNIPEEQIPKPRMEKGKSLPIRESMGIDEQLYNRIRSDIHKLVHMAKLDWQKDFHHQDVMKLAKVFNGAAKEFPILKRYTHHWATAAIAARYLQNIRRNARENGYLPKCAKYNRGGRHAAQPEADENAMASGNEGDNADGSNDDD
ncbi:hypothetical protein BV20DRAFT_1051601 [Pilatotrama ljubarskyi]|nr:hypothetical protein BV20DRAFT_1051601 [Pilatotrama ljubarskyi]